MTFNKENNSLDRKLDKWSNSADSKKLETEHDNYLHCGEK
jgi:hypothetical protein